MSPKKPDREAPAAPPLAAAIWGGLLGVVVLGVYLLTMSPTIPPGDSGEFITVAATSGVAHPSGYPAFTLLSHVFGWIPFGSYAWRINLLSGLAGVGAALFVFATVYRLTEDRWASLTAMGLFAFSPLVWRYALVAEVFSLNNLFLAAFLFFLVRLLEEPTVKRWYALVVSLALGLTNHHTLGLVGFPILGYALLAERRLLLRPRVLLVSLALGVAAQLPYLYLPIAASAHPIVSWGDPTTWDGFLAHLLRREYGTLKLSPGTAGTMFWEAIRKYLVAVPREALYLGIPLALLGLLGDRGDPVRRHFRWATVLGFLAYMGVFNGLANLPLEVPLYYDVYTRFWQVPNLIVFLWLGLGVHFLGRRLPLLATALVVLVPIQLAVNYAHEDQSDNYLFYDKGRSILEILPMNALLISSGDVTTNTVRYLQQVEGFRTDVTVIDLNMLRTGWYGATVARHYPDVRLPRGTYAHPAGSGHYSLLDLLQANRSRPLFVAVQDTANRDETWREGFDSWPFGFVEWMVPENRPFSLDDYLEHTDLARIPMKGERFEPVREDSWDWIVQRDYWEIEHRKVRRVLGYVTAEGVRPDLLEWAVERLEFLTRENPEVLPGVYRTLGIAYGELAKRDEALVEAQVEAWDRYLHMQRGAVPDPDLPAIREFVRDHRSGGSEGTDRTDAATP